MALQKVYISVSTNDKYSFSEKAPCFISSNGTLRQLADLLQLREAEWKVVQGEFGLFSLETLYIDARDALAGDGSWDNRHFVAGMFPIAA
jgi:hypothetical protein